MNGYAVAGATFGLLSLVLVVKRPAAKWLKKVKRRRGGVYLWRVDKHNGRGRHNGYVGETVNFYFRSRQHMGVSKRYAVPAQPWSDLRPVMHKVIKLPWWLCWKWVLRPLETMVILLTWPVYNDSKNRWNPRRASQYLAKRQRTLRDGYRERIHW